jgi:hypothetical protein
MSGRIRYAHACSSTLLECLASWPEPGLEQIRVQSPISANCHPSGEFWKSLSSTQTCSRLTTSPRHPRVIIHRPPVALLASERLLCARNAKRRSDPYSLHSSHEATVCREEWDGWRKYWIKTDGGPDGCAIADYYRYVHITAHTAPDHPAGRLLLCICLPVSHRVTPPHWKNGYGEITMCEVGMRLSRAHRTLQSPLLISFPHKGPSRGTPPAHASASSVCRRPPSASLARRHVGLTRQPVRLLREHTPRPTPVLWTAMTLPVNLCVYPAPYFEVMPVWETVGRL